MTDDKSKTLTNLIKSAHLLLGNKVVPVYMAKITSLSKADNNLLTNALNFYALGGGLAGILGADFRASELRTNTSFDKLLTVTQDTQFTRKVVRTFLDCMHKYKSILMKLQSTMLHEIINILLEHVSSNRHIRFVREYIDLLLNMGFNFNIKEWYCLLFSSSLDKNVPIDIRITYHTARFADVVITAEVRITCIPSIQVRHGEKVEEKVPVLVVKRTIFRSRRTATDAMKPVANLRFKGLPVALRKVNRLIGQEIFIPMKLGSYLKLNDR